MSEENIVNIQIHKQWKGNLFQNTNTVATFLVSLWDKEG